MKKLLGISLVAMMAVTSARADIASKAYVDPIKGIYVDPANKTAGQNINALDDAIVAVKTLTGNTSVADQIAAAVDQTYDSTSEKAQAGKAVAGAIADMQTKTNLTNDLDTDKAETTKYPSAKAVYDADKAITDSIGDVPQGSTVMQEIATASAATNFVENSITDGVTAKAPSEDAVHDALALKEDVISSTNKVDVGFIDETNYDASGLKTILDAQYDPIGAASSAGDSAKAYADSLASNYDAAGAASNVKTAVDAYTVNSKQISTNPTLAGGDIALTNYAKGNDSSAVAASDTVNAAIGKLENQIAGATAGTTSAIEALDATESQTAGADGLALSVTEVDGVITGISGSIAANTYEPYGAVAEAMDATTGTLVKHTANTAAGSGTNPVYIAADGTATASTSTVGAADTPVYLSNGTITAGTQLGTAAYEATTAFDAAGTASGLVGTLPTNPSTSQPYATVGDALSAVNTAATGGVQSVTANNAGGVVTAVTQNGTAVETTKADPLTTMDYTRLTANQGDGVYALTMKLTNDVPEYKWEMIQRAE